MPVSQQMLLDMDVVRSFVAISDTGSFSGAARAVNRTPSAISMQIKKLEEQLDRQLFVREGRRVALTADGESLLSFAQQMLRLNAEALTRFQGDEVEGQISFGAPDDFGTRFLPNILSRFARTHPNVEVNVVLGTSADLLNRMEAEELDIGLVTTRPQGSSGPGRLVFSEPLVWVGVRNGRAKDKPALSLALAGQSCAWRSMALEQLNQLKRPYRIAYTCENCQGQMAALMADLAIAPLPLSLLAPGLERLGEADGLPTLQHYEVRMLEQSAPGPAAKAFASHVIDSFADLAPLASHSAIQEIA